MTVSAAKPEEKRLGWFVPTAVDQAESCVKPAAEGRNLARMPNPQHSETERLDHGPNWLKHTEDGLLLGGMSVHGSFKETKMKPLNKMAKIGVLGLFLTSAASLPSPVAASDEDHDWSNIEVTFVVWLGEGIEVFNPFVEGAQDAARQQGITINIQYGDGDPAKMNNIMETAVANGVDGMIVSIWDDQAFDTNVCAAVDQGIKVVIANIDDSEGNAGRDCDLAFVGQDFVEAGKNLGRAMIAKAGIQQGDKVFVPVEFPEAVYATKRFSGVNAALNEVGAEGELIGVGPDPSAALSIMTQYMIGHADTKAVIGLGLVPTSVAPIAIKEAGLNILNGGFDLSKTVVENLLAGDTAVASDQQMYSQGHLSVTQLSQLIKYGLQPANVSTGGTGIVDASNVGKASDWAAITR